MIKCVKSWIYAAALLGSTMVLLNGCGLDLGGGISDGDQKEVEGLTEIDQEEVVLGIVKNIVEGVKVGANIEFITEYWNNSTPKKRSKVLNRNGHRPASRKMIRKDVVTG